VSKMLRVVLADIWNPGMLLAAWMKRGGRGAREPCQGWRSKRSLNRSTLPIPFGRYSCHTFLTRHVYRSGKLEEVIGLLGAALTGTHKNWRPNTSVLHWLFRPPANSEQISNTKILKAAYGDPPK
jgi:hypothetical protein